MSLFSVELPLKDGISRGAFVAELLAWLRGVKGCSLFRDGVVVSEENEAHLISDTGETFVVRECGLLDGIAVGAVHEVPDRSGRYWRTEITLLSRPSKSALTVRSQCLLSDSTEVASVPKKPFFLKMIIEDGWLKGDYLLEILQEAHFLAGVDGDFDLINSIISKSDLFKLPVILVLCDGHGRPYLSDERIRDLSLQLGGLSHVVVVGNYRLMRRIVEEISDVYSDYGVCVYFGKSGLMRSYGRYTRNLFIFEDLIPFVYSLVSTRKPQIGWSFQNVVEEIARQAQERYRKESLTLEEMFDLTQEALIEKDKIISMLQTQLQDTQDSVSSKGVDFDISGFMSVGPELYDGEFHDRLRLVLEGVSQRDGLVDERTREFSRRLARQIPPNEQCTRLIERLKSAGRAGKNSEDRIISILVDIGFKEVRSQNHRVLDPSDLFGLDSQTFSCTSSDHRAGQNAVQRIIRALNLRELSGDP